MKKIDKNHSSSNDGFASLFREHQRSEDDGLDIEYSPAPFLPQEEVSNKSKASGGISRFGERQTLGGEHSLLLDNHRNINRHLSTRNLKSLIMAHGDFIKAAAIDNHLNATKNAWHINWSTEILVAQASSHPGSVQWPARAGKKLLSQLFSRLAMSEALSGLVWINFAAKNPAG